MNNKSLKKFMHEVDKMNAIFKEPSKSGFQAKELKKLMKALKKKKYNKSNDLE